MKNRKIFGFAAALLLTMIVAGGLWAQAVPGIAGGSGWQSPQSTATQGRYRSAADDYMRPDTWTSAKIENWFGFTSFMSGNTVHLGYANKMDNMYIAAYYGGKFWANTPQNNYTERDITWVTGSTKTIPVYTTIPAFGTTAAGTTPDNRVSILLGVADMGFRLSFTTDHQSFKNTDFRQGATDYKNYERGFGNITPQIAWAMSKDLSGNGIRPWITFDLDFYRNYTKTETYTTGTTTSGEMVANSQNYFRPIIYLGMGGYTFVNKNGFKGSFDLDNYFEARAYNNDYEYNDGGTYKTNSVKGTFSRTPLTGRTRSIAEESYVMDRLTPSVSGSWSGGPLALKFKLNMNLQLSNTKITEMDYITSLVKDGTDSSATYFGFNPDLRLAAQWKIVPKLTLNAGGRINLNSAGRTTTKGSTYTNGAEDPDSSYKTVAKTIGATANTLTLGATFLPTGNLTFEAACGVGSGNEINVFGNTSTDTGLFRFTNLLVSLKY